MNKTMRPKFTPAELAALVAWATRALSSRPAKDMAPDEQLAANALIAAKARALADDP